VVEGFVPCGSPLVPAIDPHFVFELRYLRNLLAFLAHPGKDGLWVGGPTGAGKTSLIQQTAARLNWPTMNFSWHRRREFSDLIGHWTTVNGSMQFMHGPLAVAMREGYLLLLNEVDRGDTGELVGFHDILDGSPLMIAENNNEIIKPHAKFRLVVTGNSMGGGDQTGLYGAVQQADIAFMDRFRVMNVEYLPPEIEEDILERVAADIPADFREKMVKVANEVRRLFIGSGDTGAELSLTMSTRTLVRWASMSLLFRGAPNALAYALDGALTARAEPEQAQAINKIAENIFGDAWSTGQGSATNAAA